MAKKKAETNISKEDVLALWTRRFSNMLSSGVSIISALRSLEEEETSYGLREITHSIADKVQEGSTIYEALENFPEYFDDYYIGSVKMGECGGILDVTFRRFVERMEKGINIPRPVEKDKLSRAELSEWCWCFGTFLSGGTPLLSALESLTGLGHTVLREVTRRMHQEVSAGYPLLTPSSEVSEGKPKSVMLYFPGIFTPTLRNLIRVGLIAGNLDQMMMLASEQIANEAKLEAEGKLPMLSALPDETLPPAPFEEPGVQPPVVRRVNDLFIAAFNADAGEMQLIPGGGGNGNAQIIKEGKCIQTIPLEDYSQAISRIKIMAEIDPLTKDERSGTIYVRHEGKDYEVLVRSMPSHLGKLLWLSIRKGTKAVQM
jgi:hypothetical protein